MVCESPMSLLVAVEVDAFRTMRRPRRAPLVSAPAATPDAR